MRTEDKPTMQDFHIEGVRHINPADALEALMNQEAVLIDVREPKAVKLFYKSGLTPAEVMDLIPVKPIGEHEPEIKNILNTKLIGLFGKIKP